MSASDWATIVYSYFFVLVAVGTGVWLMFKKVFKHLIEEHKEDIKTIKAEVTPNHGSSMNDSIKLEILPILKELRANQVEIGHSVSNLEGKFEQHIREHSK